MNQPVSTPTAPEAGGPQPLDPATENDVGGGLSCRAEELNSLTASLKQSYEDLVDFTSHVIERVAGK